jgi:hypothetical protein
MPTGRDSPAMRYEVVIQAPTEISLVRPLYAYFASVP